MPPHPLINFIIQRYYQNEPTFNGAYSKNNLLVVPICAAQIKDGSIYNKSWWVKISTTILDSSEFER